MVFAQAERDSVAAKAAATMAALRCDMFRNSPEGVYDAATMETWFERFPRPERHLRPDMPLMRIQDAVALTIIEGST